MIALSVPMIRQLQLFEVDKVEAPCVRQRVVVDKEERRRRREARRQFQARLKLLPCLESVLVGEEPIVTPTGVRQSLPPLSTTTAVKPDQTFDHDAAGVPERALTRAERKAIREQQRELRRDRGEKRRVRQIFSLQDVDAEWISEKDLAAMDAEIERAAREVQRNWSDNERRKRRKGLNSDEKDPDEHWLPMFVSVMENHSHEGSE